MLYEVCDSNAEMCGYFSDLNGIGLRLNKIVDAKIIVHAFKFCQSSIYMYLLLLTRTVKNIMLEIANFEEKKEKKDKTGTFVTTAYNLC